MTSRVPAFLATVVAHIALIALLAGERAVRDERPADESRMVLVFLAQDARVRPAEPPTPSPGSSRREKEIAARASGFSEHSRVIFESLPRESPSPSTDPLVDWSRESELAAQRQVDAIESARRRDRGFTSRDGDLELASPAAPSPEFGWDHSQTHRIEPIPTGGTLIHINDRCFVVISGLIMPVCKLGKIEARGDLFEHMNDTPQLGDAE